jgi:DNA-binding MarR family transcriptional regulator
MNGKPTADSSGPDPLIHEPVRLQLITLLMASDAADFTFLLGAAGLTRGNLSTHMARLVAAKYVDEHKFFANRIPRTEYRLTAAGRAAYRRYIAWWKRTTGQ